MMPIFGLPNRLADTIMLILDPDGKGIATAKDAALRERERELLIIFALHVYRDEQFADKSWRSVIRYFDDPTEAMDHKLQTIIGRAATTGAGPGSLDWFSADLAGRYLRMPFRAELGSAVAAVRADLHAAEDAICSLQIIEDGERRGGQGKGLGFAINATSWPTSHFVQDEKPQYVTTGSSDVRKAYENVSLSGETTRDIVYGRNDLDATSEPFRKARDE